MTQIYHPCPSSRDRALTALIFSLPTCLDISKTRGKVGENPSFKKKKTMLRFTIETLNLVQGLSYLLRVPATGKSIMEGLTRAGPRLAGGRHSTPLCKCDFEELSIQSTRVCVRQSSS